MQLNKNGIPVRSSGRKRKRVPLDHCLETRRFRLIDREADVEVVIPSLSPIIELMERDGWEEIK